MNECLAVWVQSSKRALESKTWSFVIVNIYHDYLVLPDSFFIHAGWIFTPCVMLSTKLGITSSLSGAQVKKKGIAWLVWWDGPRVVCEILHCGFWVRSVVSWHCLHKLSDPNGSWCIAGTCTSLVEKKFSCDSIIPIVFPCFLKHLCTGVFTVFHLNSLVISDHF